jgi:hypothetical protein
MSAVSANNYKGLTGAPEEIRTPDPQIRSLVLYPAELRALRSALGGEIWPKSDGALAVFALPGKSESRALDTHEATATAAGCFAAPAIAVRFALAHSLALTGAGR